MFGGLDLTHLISVYGYLAVFAFVCIESLGIPFPGETMLVTAALYAGAGHRLSIVLVIVAAAAGAIVGDNIGFSLGHWGGYRLLVRYGDRVRIDQEKVRIGRYVFLRHGVKVVFLGRFASVLRTYAAFLAGTTHMPRLRFLIANAAGGMVWAAVFGIGAFLLGSQIERVSRPLGLALGLIALLVMLGFLVAARRAESHLGEMAKRALPGPLPGYPGGPPL